MTIRLGPTLAARRAAGGKLLVCYLMAGSTPDWLDVAHALVEAGADALEVGVAFSDPLIDGPVIQEAAGRALGAGCTLARVTDALGTAALGVPLVAMTYLNVLARPGYRPACELLAAGTMSGVIVPDLPLAELEAWQSAAHPAGVETVLLAAPSTSTARLGEIARRSEGFLYAVGRMATTGEREDVDPAGVRLVESLKSHTSLPVCLGIGVATPEQAATVAGVADGVVVGSAIVRRMLEGATPDAVGAFARSLRLAIDASC